MTKYGHYLAALERDCPPDWRGKFIRYKMLKKALKECQGQVALPPPADGSDAGPAAGLPAGSMEQREAKFFDLLNEELRKADKCFYTTAQAIVVGFQRIEVRRKLACCFPRLLAAGPGRYADLAERAYWCRKYARANAVALRKILKKHDKQCGSQEGHCFLQQCWRLPSGGSFLHSPLLDELKAIQDVLHEQRMQWEDIQLCEVADTSVKGGSKVAAANQAAAGCAMPGDKAAAAALQGSGCHHLARESCGASSSDMGMAAGTGTGTGQHQLDEAMLTAIIESPTCMMSSSDFEWAAQGDSGCAGSGGAPGPRVASSADGSAVDLHRPSLDMSVFSSAPLSASTFSPGTSPPGTGGGGCANMPASSPPAAVVTPPTAGGGSGGGVSRPVAGRGFTASSRFKDEDLKCPICLEPFYKPVGLACGHKFCKQCALEYAGLRRVIGTFHNLCSYVSSTVACPQCRQPAVYKRAVRMRHLDRVLKSRYPEEWRDRREEERARERALVEQAATSPSGWRWLNTINARDALLGM